MKTNTRIIIVALFFLLAGAGIAQTNVYHPFPNDTAYWGIATSNAGCSSSPCPFERIMQMGDTIVNSTVYHKVYSQWGTFGPPSNCGGMGSSCFTPSTALGLKCLLRQDSAAQKVYVSMPPFTKDTLLYNFGLHLGDTLPKTYAWAGGSYPNGTAIVHKIDSILIGGHYNKVFIIDPNHLSECSYLVEGVGSSTDLLSMGCSIGSYQWVTCFNQDPVQFGSSASSCGNYAIAGIASKKSKAAMQIIPNPTHGIIQITLPENSILVRISDVCGKEVKSQRVTGQNVELDLSAFDNGIYLVEVRTSQGTITQKIILDR